MPMVSTVEGLIMEPLHQPMHFQQGVKVTKITFPLLIKGKFDKRIKKSLYFCSLFEQFQMHIRFKVYEAVLI